MNEFEALYGPMPNVGDRVYIDFGDSVLTGGETTGTVLSVEDNGLNVDGTFEPFADMVHFHRL